MLIVVCRIKISISCIMFGLFLNRKLYMSKNTLKKFGAKVREERLKRNLSQEELAEMAGVHRTYIGMIERAEKNITLENIKKIGSALKISLSSLFEGID